MVTAKFVRNVTGMSERQLDGWCNRGAKPGMGSGFHRMFTIPELFGLVQGYSLHRAGYGKAAEASVWFLASFTEDELRAEFKAGNRFFIPRTDAPMELVPLPEGLEGSCVDLEAEFEKVVEAVRKRERKLIEAN